MRSMTGRPPIGRRTLPARARPADANAVLGAPVPPVDVAQSDGTDGAAAGALDDHEFPTLAVGPQRGEPRQVLLARRRALAEQLGGDRRLGAPSQDGVGVALVDRAQEHALAGDHARSSSRISDSAAMGRAAARPTTRSSASGASPKPSLPQRRTETLSALSRSPGVMARVAKMLRRAKPRSSSSSGSVSLRP